MMEWILRKDKDNCSIKIKKSNGEEDDFSYIEMIKALYEKEKIEPANYEGEFSDKEKESINELISDINDHVQNFFESSNNIDAEKLTDKTGLE